MQPRWTGMGTFRIPSSTAPSPNAQSSVHSTLLGRRNRLKGSRVGGLGLAWAGRHVSRAAPHPSNAATAVAGGLRHHMWLEHPVAKAVAGSSYRCQADFDMESVRIACSGEAASRGLVDCQTS